MMFRSSAIMSDTTNIWITYGHPGIIIGVAKAGGADCVAVRGDVNSSRDPQVFDPSILRAKPAYEQEDEVD